MQVSILPSPTSVEILSLAHRSALFSFSQGKTEATCNMFHNWTVSSAGTRSQSSAWHWLFSCGITEVLGTLLFAEANNSLTGFEASRLFDNQHFCTGANKNKYQLWRALLLLTPRWEDVAVGADLHPHSTLACMEGRQSSFPPSALC